MGLERLKRLLEEQEGIRLEFKEARTALPVNVFETICAMLNRDGGDIILGADDNGKIIGVEHNKIESIVANLVNLSNNPQKLEPPFILFPQTYKIEGKWLIHIQVPASSQVHKTVNKVFNRSNDGDFKVTQPQQIAEIYNYKTSHYTEGIIYPALRFEDFKADLFPKIKNLIRSHNDNHPWLALTDQQMLEKAGLWKRDLKTAQEGYTLAAALLLGNDETIQQIIPYFKIDALVRREDIYRYDDREYIQTNLIEAYEQLMTFISKHLPDKFYMQGDQRVSLRNKIFREIVANLIVHREYMNAYPCTFIIYEDRVEVENANNPHGEGPIDPERFAPFPKNPAIVKFFMQLGRVDELGSGVLNVNRLIKEYTDDGTPQFIEGNVFKTVIPIAHESIEGAVEGAVEGAIEGVVEGVTQQVKEKLTLLLQMIAENEGQKVPYYAAITKMSVSSVERYIKQLKTADLIDFRGKSTLTGGYYLTDKMKKKLKGKIHGKNND